MKLPRDLSGVQVVKALESLGFVRVRQKGSHVRLTYLNRRVTVPMHREIHPGTLKSILNQAQITIEELIRHL